MAPPKGVSNNPLGRASGYKPEYCEMLEKHMASGFSFRAFAGVVGTTRQTLYNWIDEHEEFAEAKEVGTNRCLYHWEKIMLEHIVHTQRGKRVDPNMWKYNMTVRFKEDWQEATDKKVEAEVKHQDMTVTLNLSGG